MTHDEPFRTILLVGFCVLLPFGIYRRLKSRTGEKLNRRQEGLFVLVTLRLLGIMGVIGTVAYLVNPSSMAWGRFPLPDWSRWIGVGIGAVAGLLVFWTLRTLGRNLTDTVATRKTHTLVTTGPYAWVRHPFYCSAALLVLGISLVTANWFLFCAGGFAIVLLVVRTGREEENLIARFGDEYGDYMGRTGRFWPRRGTRLIAHQRKG